LLLIALSLICTDVEFCYIAGAMVRLDPPFPYTCFSFVLVPSFHTMVIGSLGLFPCTLRAPSPSPFFPSLWGGLALFCFQPLLFCFPTSFQRVAPPLNFYNSSFLPSRRVLIGLCLFFLFLPVLFESLLSFAPLSLLLASFCR
jgi:hypothetical protein